MPSTLGLLAGAAVGSGIKLYAVVALLGLLGRATAGEVPDSLTATAVIVAAVGLFAVEFVAGGTAPGLSRHALVVKTYTPM